jgi:hypothetical protein
MARADSSIAGFSGGFTYAVLHPKSGLPHVALKDITHSLCPQ